MAAGFVPNPQLHPFQPRWFDSSVSRVHHLDEGVGTPILLLHGNPPGASCTGT